MRSQPSGGGPNNDLEGGANASLLSSSPSHKEPMRSEVFVHRALTTDVVNTSVVANWEPLVYFFSFLLFFSFFFSIGSGWVLADWGYCLTDD
jgi:hypothetical protein